MPQENDKLLETLKLDEIYIHLKPNHGGRIVILMILNECLIYNPMLKTQVKESMVATPGKKMMKLTCQDPHLYLENW